MKRILRIHEVVELVGLSRATIYRLVNEHRFPSPVRISTRAIGWKRTDIETWIAELCPVLDLTSTK